MENGLAPTTPISVTIIATLAAIIVILVTIIAIIVVVILLRRKASRAGTACEEIVHDEIPDATKRQDLQQGTDITQTGSNPAYNKPTSHLPTSSKEMEMTQNYAYAPTNIPVKPNKCYSPNQLKAAGKNSSQLTTTEEHAYEYI